MHNFLDNLQQGGTYSSFIAIHQADLRREENLIDQKLLSISNLQIRYLNLDNSVKNNGRDDFSQSRCSYCGGSHPTEKRFKQHRKEIL